MNNDNSVPFQEVINSLNVPETRKDLGKRENVKWLIRNVRFENNLHPEIDRIVRFLVRIDDAWWWEEIV